MSEHRVSRLEGFLLRMGTLGELFRGMIASGRWWMVPLGVLLAVIGIVLVVTNGAQAVAPFIYMIF